MDRTDYWIALVAMTIAVLVLAILPNDNLLAAECDKRDTEANDTSDSPRASSTSEPAARGLGRGVMAGSHYGGQ